MADLRRLQAHHAAAGGVPKQVEERIEMTKIFCATHELEIDLLMQVYEALSKAAENTHTTLL